MSNTLKLEDCNIINSLSVCILDKTKKIDKLTITGKRVGIIWGRESKINFIKIKNGRPRPTISSISCTLFARQKSDTINNRIKNELLSSCLSIYLSTNFIE